MQNKENDRTPRLGIAALRRAMAFRFSPSVGRYVVKAFSSEFPVTFYRQIPSKPRGFEGILHQPNKITIPPYPRLRVQRSEPQSEAKKSRESKRDAALRHCDRFTGFLNCTNRTKTLFFKSRSEIPASLKIAASQYQYRMIGTCLTFLPIFCRWSANTISGVRSK